MATQENGSTGPFPVYVKVPNGQFPRPIIIPPTLEHHQTFIILHGRGSFAEEFAPPLLSMESTSKRNLRTAFPHAKLIFLTATRNRATVYKRSYTHQWFDSWHLDEAYERQYLMHEGLKKSCEYVHGVLREEVAEVGERNVVLWGLSQGCATSVFSLLMWDGRPFGAVVGMCGWLPFSNHVREIASGGIAEKDNSSAEDEDDDPFARSDDDGDDPLSCSDEEEQAESGGVKNHRSTKMTPAEQALAFLRSEIDMENKTCANFQNIPVFLGHGTEDEKVGIDLGRELRICLELVGGDVQMVEYNGLGHWYSPEMLEDIFDFLRKNLD